MLHARVVNDTDEPVRCTPGAKRGSNALLQTDLDVVCEPHAEVGFLFSVPRFARSGRSAFVRVSGSTFECGFDAPIEEDALRVAAISIGIAALLAVLAVGIVLYRRRQTSRPPQTEPPKDHAPPVHAPQEPAPPERPAETPVESLIGELVDVAGDAGVEELGAPLARQYQPPEPPRGVETRGFAAVLDDRRVVMGALECTQRGLFSSDFIAKVVNQSPEPVLCTVSARTRHGVVPLAPGSFRVDSKSVAAVSVAAPLRLPWRLRTLHLVMESVSLRASAQAEIAAPLGVRIALGAAGAALALAVGIAGFRTMRPAIAGFAVPSRILAGDRAAASYALAGVGRGQYVVTFKGARIAGGILASESGSFTFATGRSPGVYTVHLRMTGPLGTVQRSASLLAVRQLTPMVASIGALAVEPAVVPGGGPVAVRYQADADRGTVSLAGVTGIPLERVAYSASGTATLRAPSVDTATQYQVALDVTRGGSTAHAAVGLLVLPSALVAPQPPPVSPVGMMTSGALMRIEPSRVLSATSFTLVLLAHPKNLSVDLQDSTGSVVASQMVSPQETTLRFQAPAVTADAHFTLVARFTSGTSDQAVLDPFTIYAR